MEKITIEGVVNLEDRVFTREAHSIDIIINDDNSGEFGFYNEKQISIAKVYFKEVTHYVWEDLDKPITIEEKS